MVIPAIPLPLAFAIGLSVGVVGYVGQALIRRRSHRRATDTTATAWGPTTPAVDDAIATAPETASPATPAVEPATKKSGRARGYGAGADQRQVAPEATPLAERAVGGGLTPMAGAALADRRKKTAVLTQLRKRESYLEDALDAIVGFVDAEPRRAKARICAKALSDLVPRARRSPQFNDFLRDAESGKGPSTLQDDAELVGVQLATELKQVKTELISLSG